MTTRPYRLRADAFFVKTDDGVWLRNNAGSFSIGGRSAYPLVKRLFAKLEDGSTLDELCDGLAADKRRIVEQVVRRLEQHGFVRPVAPHPERVPAWASSFYGEQLRFIEHHLDEPYARFSRFRSQPIACEGEGELLSALVTALAEYGAANVRVRARREGELDALRDVATLMRRRDPGLAYIVEPASSKAPGVDPACRIVLIEGSLRECSTSAGPTLVHDTPTAAVVHRGDDLIAIPPLAASDRVCLRCALHSLPDSGDAREVAVPPVAASLVANQIAYWVFCRLVGMPVEPDDGALRRIDARTLTVKSHRVLPHPLCERHGRAAMVRSADSLQEGHVRPDLPSGLDGAELVEAQDALTTRLARWTDALTGPLLRLGEHDLAQLPLAGSGCVVPHLGARDLHPPHTVTCRGLCARETRLQSVLLALEWQAKELVSARELCTSVHMPFIGVGWSATEAAYRALHRATLACALSLEPLGDLEEVRRTNLGEHLLALLAEEAPGVRVATAQAPTGLFAAEAYVLTGARGRGAGGSALAAKLEALLDLAVTLTSPEAATHTAKLTFGVTSWSSVLAEARRRRGPNELVAFQLEGLFPFADDGLHVVVMGERSSR